MIDRFCVVFHVLFAFDVCKVTQFKLFTIQSIFIDDFYKHKKNSLIQFGDKMPAVITFSPRR